MNLEYDDDELDLLKQVGEVLQKIAPIPETGKDGGHGRVWPLLVEAGWSEIGAAVHDGDLELGVAADLFRRAGRQLQIEEFVSSAFLLSSLATLAEDDLSREKLRRHLKHAPGVLLGDGRSRAVPIVDGGAVTGLCFGVSPGCDVYRVIERDSTHLLQRWRGAPAVAEPVAGLSSSVASIAVKGDVWEDYPLRLDPDTLDRLETDTLIVHSAALIGCGERLLGLTCDYVRTRIQFGVQIGSFQAVKHALADMYTALVVAWNATLTACADGADELLAPLVARVLAVDAALGAARGGAQFHGGMGFTAELNVHLFLKALLDGVQRFAAPGDVAIDLGRRFAEASC